MTRLITLFFAFCVFTFSPGMAAAAEGGKLLLLRKPITMDYGTSPLLAVVFNHSTHKKVKCRTCHHMEDNQGKRFVKCTIKECHSTPGARQRGPLSMFMAYHARDTDRSCYGCHKMEAATHPEFKGCRPCHMSPMSRQAIADMEKPAAK